jgi:hypothetical protein
MFIESCARLSDLDYQAGAYSTLTVEVVQRWVFGAAHLGLPLYDTVLSRHNRSTLELCAP